MVIALSIFLLLASLLLPSIQAFGVLLIASLLGVTPNGVDVAGYLMIILFFKEIVFKELSKGYLLINALTKLFLTLFAISLVSFLIFRGTFAQETILAYARITFPLFLIFRLCNNQEKLAKLIPFIWWGEGLVLLHIYLQYLGLHPLADLVKTKWGRLVPNDLANHYINSNTYGAYISWLIAFLVAYYRVYQRDYIAAHNRFWRSYGLLGLFFLAVPVLGLLGTRANLILLILTYSVVFLNLNLTRIALVSPLIIGFFFFIDFESYILNNDIPLIGEVGNDRLDLLFYESNLQDNRSRLSLLKAGFQLFLENPLFGVGLGNEVDGIERISGQDMVSHNSYVNLLSELGLLGVLINISLILIWRKHYNSRIFLVLLIALLAYGFFHEIKNLSITWIMMALFWLMMELQHLETRWRTVN